MSWSHTITARKVSEARDALKSLADDILPADAEDATKEQVSAAAEAAGYLLDDYHEDEFVAINMYGHAEATDDSTGLKLRPITSVAVAIGQRTVADVVPLPASPTAQANEATGPAGVAASPTAPSGAPVGPIAGDAGTTIDDATQGGALVANNAPDVTGGAAPAGSAAAGATAAPVSAAEAVAAGTVKATNPAVIHADELGVDITQVQPSKGDTISKADVAAHAEANPPAGGVVGAEQPTAGAAGDTTTAATGGTAPTQGATETTSSTGGADAAAVVAAATGAKASGDKAQIGAALADVNEALLKWPGDAGLIDAKAQLEQAQQA